jgi:two-component system, OmpR family, phosphate regulon sensor histidine kinase PhoR
MTRGAARPLRSLALVAGLLAALSLLATLQNRWITQLSDAERERLQATLETAAERFCDDFDRELTRASQTLRAADGTQDVELEAELATRLARWRSSAPVPGLVGELLVVTRHGRGLVTLARFDERTGRLAPAEWDAGLASVREIFAARGPVPVLDERLPGLILPVREGQAGEGREPRGGQDRRPPRHHVVVRLDRGHIAASFLPRLAADHFGGRDGLAYSVVVRAAGASGTVVLAAGPAVAADAPAGADLTRPLFSLRFFPELAGGAEGGAAPRRDPAPPRPPEPRRADPGDQRPPPQRRQDDRDADAADASGAGPAPRRAGAEVGRWLLEVRHPSGSLEAVVAGARRRNLAVSLAIVALLGTVGVLMVVSTRRAQRLASQQMDFVASVSHELRTPLTAMRSAGQNLADGIVHDPERVKRYGALVEREGRRLTEMVDRVLAFAGISTGQQSYSLEPLEVGPLVRAVLSDSRFVLDERGFEVETSVPDDLPAVRGDASALRQALSNLVDNAVKYGAAARWIGVRARTASTGRGDEVAIAVSDRGPGIRRPDLAHLFEPFFRGRDARTAATPGSGLGLAVVRRIVEAHGGRVEVDSAPGRGSTFTIHLPAVPSAGRTDGRT